jgi:hypothetical protein
LSNFKPPPEEADRGTYREAKFTGTTHGHFRIVRDASLAETSVEGDHRALYSPLNLAQEADALSMKTSKRIALQTDATGEQQLAGFIKKFDSKNAALIRSVRKVLRKRLPTANELVYDNYNFFAIGYCSTERPSDCILSIAAGANGVGLSFYHGATLPDPHRLLLGSGNQSRFIRIESAATLTRPEVEELIAAAIKYAEGPLSGSGRGKLGHSINLEKTEATP